MPSASPRNSPLQRTEPIDTTPSSIPMPARALRGVAAAREERREHHAERHAGEGAGAWLGAAPLADRHPRRAARAQQGHRQQECREAARHAHPRAPQPPPPTPPKEGPGEDEEHQRQRTEGDARHERRETEHGERAPEPVPHEAPLVGLPDARFQGRRGGRIRGHGHLPEGLGVGRRRGRGVCGASRVQSAEAAPLRTGRRWPRPRPGRARPRSPAARHSSRSARASSAEASRLGWRSDTATPAHRSRRSSARTSLATTA